MSIYDNQSNTLTSNIFETCTGALNIAPIKISGQYKIVLSTDGNMYFDDYTGRRVIIDTSKSYFPQLANFLKTKTTIVSNDILRYGAFQKSTVKSYHIPFYLSPDSNKYPKYFVLARVINETISESSYLYKYGSIKVLQDLEDLEYIFDQIIAEDYYDYPLYFNWEDGNVRLYGYSIQDKAKKYYTLDLVNSQANQPYFDILNNKILNTYLKQDMIFPRFINLEFEFEYSSDITFFNNFFGYLSYATEIETSAISATKFNVKVQDLSTEDDVWEQVTSTDIITLNTYIDITGSGTIQEVSEKSAQVRFKTSRAEVGDIIKIYHADGDLDFSYTVVSSDIDSTSLYATWIKICKSATKASEKDYVFSATEISDNVCYIKIVTNIIDDYIEEYTITLPSYFTILDRYDSSDDNYYQFRSLTTYDVWLSGQPTLADDVTTVCIDSVYYTITDKFKFNGKAIIRLSSAPDITKATECSIYNTETEKLIQLDNIPWLSYNSDLKSYVLFNQTTYCAELLAMFPDASSYIATFLSKAIDSPEQYIDEEDEELIPTTTITVDDSNTEIVKNIMFSSVGQTSFITPNIFNICKEFYVQNGNIDMNQLDSDILRYNWFLIKGTCPTYLASDIRSLRYFTDTPKLTSRIVRIGDSYCETVFLGVKYQFPSEYEGYSFAVYASINDKTDETISYKFTCSASDKTLYLSINKYLDFVDLLRGGDATNEPLLDLSFFYSVDSSYNSASEYLGDFKSTVLKFGDTFKSSESSIYFNGVEVRDWKYKYNGKWYIALRRTYSSSEDKVNDLTTLIDSSASTTTFYVYSTITYNDVEYTYISMSCLLENIVEIASGYIWCEDIKITFFDSTKIFLQKYNETTNVTDILYVDKERVLESLVNKSSNLFGDYVKISTIVVDGENKTFELLLPDKTVSIKEYYFEIIQTITESDSGAITPTIEVFKFDEYALGLTDAELITKFLGSSVDTSVYSGKITLFNRNQVWRVIQDLFKSSLKFKYLSKVQVRNIINKFMVTNLMDYVDINSIPVYNYNSSGTLISEDQQYIKLSIIDNERNVSILNLIDVPKLVLLNRYKTAYMPYMKIIESELLFQLSTFQTYSTIFNTYDKNFGGTGISATGLWEETQGNVVSTLFCKDSDIEIQTSTASSINYKTILISYFDIDQCIVTDENSDYISAINANVSTYTLDAWAIYLLKRFYSLDSVTDQDGTKVKYTINSKNSYIIDISTDLSEVDYLIFIFKRK
jgi:hypothetical protein